MQSALPEAADVGKLLNEIDLQGKIASNGDLKARKELLAAARKLCRKLEDPMEAIVRMEWAEPALNAALRISVNIKLFEKLSEDADAPKNSTQLATMTGTNLILLRRILKHLASMEVISEVDTETYGSTRLSKALIEPKYRDGIPFCFDVIGPALLGLPKYLFSTEYENPTDPFQSPFQFSHKYPKHVFEYFGENPETAVHFNNHMEGYSIGRARWTDPGCVAVDQMLGEGAIRDDGSVMLVDIGGGTGRDIKEFQRQYPQLPGRLVLQDLPSVVKDAIELPSSVEVMGHDFFTPQPVQGARAYYMHSVLHDWPDAKCQEILRNIMPSMKKGYSKILVNENVIPDKQADWKITSIDFIMMGLLSSTERTEASWRELFASVGMKVVKIWTYEQGTESLIEAELA